MILEGIVWFIAIDVAKVLGVRQPHRAYARLGAEQKTTRHRMTLGMQPGVDVVLVSESGLYDLIMRSDKPQARPLQDWVTREVLPTMRAGPLRWRLSTGSLTLTPSRA